MAGLTLEQRKMLQKSANKASQKEIKEYIAKTTPKQNVTTKPKGQTDLGSVRQDVGSSQTVSRFDDGYQFGDIFKTILNGLTPSEEKMRANFADPERTQAQYNAMMGTKGPIAPPPKPKEQLGGFGNAARGMLGGIAPLPQKKEPEALTIDQVRKLYEQESAALEEFKKNNPELAKKPIAPYAQRAGSMTPEAGGGSYYNGRPDPVSEIQKQLRDRESKVSYLKNQLERMEDQAVTDKDMAEIQKMSPEARKHLEALVNWDSTASYYETFSNGEINSGFIRDKAKAQQQAWDGLKKLGYSKEKIDQLVSSLSRDINAKNAKASSESMGELAENHKFWGSVASLGTGAGAGPAGSLEAAMSAVTRMLGGGDDRYHTDDAYKPGYSAGMATESIRGAVSEYIKEKNPGAWGKALDVMYKGSMSAADNLIRAATGRGGKAIPLGLAATGSFQDSYRNATMRGASTEQALLMGVTDAAIEAFTEKFSLDRLLDDSISVDSLGKLVKSALTQGGVEASEEELGFVLNLISDSVIMGDKSEMRSNINEMVADGAAYEEAEKAVFRQTMMQALDTGVTSMFSGAVMDVGRRGKGAIKGTIKNIFGAKQNQNGLDAQTEQSYDSSINQETGGISDEGEGNLGGVRRGQESDFGERIARSAENGRHDAQSGNQVRNPEGTDREAVYTSDSEGRKIEQQNAKQLEGTAIVNEAGSPIVVYHVSDNMDFEVFNEGDVGFHFGTLEQAEKRKQKKGLQQGRMFRAYLNIKNPIQADSDIMGWSPNGTAIYLNSRGILSDAETNEILSLVAEGKYTDQSRRYNSKGATKLREILEGKGFDGISYPNGHEGKGTSYMAFHDSQIIRSEITPFGEASEASNSSHDIAPMPQKKTVPENLAPVRTDVKPRKPIWEAPIRKDIKANKDAPLAPIRKDINARKTTVEAPIRDDSQSAPDQEDQAANVGGERKEPPAKETVSGRIKKNIESSTTELENVSVMRQAAADDYKSRIADLLVEYDSKKNKNTKAANDILRRIERLKRQKADIDATYEDRIAKIEKRLEKMQSPQYRRAEQRKMKWEGYRQEIRDMIGDTSTWVDKKMGLQYQTNTLKRNLRDIVRGADGKSDIARADKIYDWLQGTYNHNEAELKRMSADIKKPFADMKINKQESAYIQMLGELQGNPETTLLPQDVEDYYQKNKGWIDQQKCEKAIAEARKVYDDLFDQVNQVLREHGMKEIGYRQGYFPHFTKDKQGPIAKLFNWKTNDGSIPTDIAGMTENFNPQRSWQSFNKERKGDVTDYDFTEGFDTYVHGALDWIYHIEDIQKRRAFEDEIRYIHSDKGVQEKIDAINADQTLDADEAQERRDAVYKEANNPLGNFLIDFHNGTNGLAGKKSTMDRSMEYATNRKVYSTMTNISNRVSANMVAANVGSALTNFIPITQSWSQVSMKNSARGMIDTIRSAFRDDGVVQKSDFLTNRLMEEEKVRKGGWDKANDAAGYLMGIIDGFTSETVWRSKYLENIKKGMSENAAIKNADSFAAGLMADRSRGNMPTIFDAKNPAIKMLTAFQLEVANQYGYMLKDMPQDMKKEGMGKLVWGYSKMFLGAYAFNALTSMVTGRDSAFDPIGIFADLMKDLGFGRDEEEEEEEEEVDVMGAVENLGKNVAQEIPFVGGLLGGGRVPISAAIPNLGKMWNDVDGMIHEEDKEKYKDSFFQELQKPLFYLAMPMGGGQAQKTIKGLGMFLPDKDHPVSGSYTLSGNMRFPVEATPKNLLQAALFGQYANKNAKQFFDEGRKALTPEQVKLYQALGEPIQDFWARQDKYDRYKAFETPIYEAGRKENATDEEKVKGAWASAIFYDIDDLKKQQKKILDGNGSEEGKRKQVRALQAQIEQLIDAGGKETSISSMSGNYAKIGDMQFIKDSHGNWKEPYASQLEAQEKGTEALGIDPGKYWDVRSEVSAKADAPNASQEDKLRNQFINHIVYKINDLYDDIETIEDSDIPAADKASQIAEVRKQLRKFGAENKQYFRSDLPVKLTAKNIASVGDSRYYKDDKGKWNVIYNNQELRQQKTSKAFGISESEYWSKHREYDFAYSNIDRYNRMMEYGVSFEEYTKGGSEIAKLISDDPDVYERIRDEIYNIDAKNDSLHSVSGLKKKRVIEYINGLDVDEGVKLILLKDEYPSDKKHNKDILAYLNGRRDISYAQKKNILLGLGVFVDKEGHIHWQ